MKPFIPELGSFTFISTQPQSVDKVLNGGIFGAETVQKININDSSYQGDVFRATASSPSHIMAVKAFSGSGFLSEFEKNEKLFPVEAYNFSPIPTEILTRLEAIGLSQTIAESDPESDRVAEISDLAKQTSSLRR